VLCVCWFCRRRRGVVDSKRVWRWKAGRSVLDSENWEGLWRYIKVDFRMTIYIRSQEDSQVLLKIYSPSLRRGWASKIKSHPIPLWTLTTPAQHISRQMRQLVTALVDPENAQDSLQNSCIWVFVCVLSPQASRREYLLPKDEGPRPITTDCS
jgi:hypothetical protein